jgi:serine/threonine-protein kinase
MPDDREGLTAALSHRYSLGQQIGAGGMAIVYLAEDLKHHRQVAIKVLHPELAATLGATRFLREIEVTAQLEHPHILPLLDSGEAAGFVYYVMPYVEGESLRDRLRREKQIGIDDALQITREVADALEYAHSRGVVHRDIKPENLLLARGHVRVADFGIALALSASSDEQRTATGLALGTPAYMSPEQAAGEKALDGRSDLYSLGCVLYEMLAGDPPYVGTTPQAIIARRALDPVPSLRTVRANVPDSVVEAIERALEKVPGDRFTTAAEFAAALVSDGQRPRAPSRQERQTISRAGAAWRTTWLSGRWLGLAVLALLAGVVLWRNELGPREPAAQVATFLVPLPKDGELADTRGLAVAISPDGTRYVYVVETPTGTQLYARPINDIRALPIPGTAGATSPFYSPDGRWIAFLADGHLKRVPASGGNPSTIVRLDGAFRGASWSVGDTILFARSGTSSGIYRVAADGGEPVLVAAPTSGEGSYHWPSQLPGGAILFSVNKGGMTWDATELVVMRPRTGERTVLLRGGHSPKYSPSGHIVFAELRSASDRVSVLRAMPFDVDRLRPLGDPATVVDSVLFTTGEQVAQFGFSSVGSLVYVAPPAARGTDTLIWVDRRGTSTPLEFQPPGIMFFAPMLSPDGRRLGLTSQVDSMKTWLVDLERRAASELSPGGRVDHFTVWSPGGDRVAFSSDVGGGNPNLYLKVLNGTEEVKRLSVSSEHQDAASWSPDGRYFAFAQNSPTTGWDIWLLDTSSQTQPRRLIHTGTDEYQPMISPDGRWLAYGSNESGRREVYVRRFPDLGDKQLVSLAGGHQPLWSPLGNEVFYIAADRWVGCSAGRLAQDCPGSLWSVAAASSESGLKLGRPTLHFPTSTTVTINGWGRPNYDMTRDGKRFLMIKAGAPVPQSRQFVLVLNWFAELERRVPRRQ